MTRNKTTQQEKIIKKDFYLAYTESDECIREDGENRYRIKRNLMEYDYTEQECEEIYDDFLEKGYIVELSYDKDDPKFDKFKCSDKFKLECSDNGDIALVYAINRLSKFVNNYKKINVPDSDTMISNTISQSHSGSIWWNYGGSAHDCDENTSIFIICLGSNLYNYYDQVIKDLQKLVDDINYHIDFSLRFYIEVGNVGTNYQRIKINLTYNDKDIWFNYRYINKLINDN